MTNPSFPLVNGGNKLGLACFVVFTGLSLGSHFKFVSSTLPLTELMNRLCTQKAKFAFKPCLFYLKRLKENSRQSVYRLSNAIHYKVLCT